MSKKRWHEFLFSRKKYFYVSGSTVTIDCEEPHETKEKEITAPGTVIISPNHPDFYPRNADCHAVIRFPQRVRITFQAFDLESFGSCAHDYLEIRDGDSKTRFPNPPKLIAKLCGTTTPTSVLSTKTAMTLIFHSDSSTSGSGFKIATERGKNRFSLCGDNIFIFLFKNPLSQIFFA